MNQNKQVITTTAKDRGMKWVWFMLTFPPILFLLVIIALSLYIGMVTEGNAQVIEEQVSGYAAHIVLCVQLLLIPFLFKAMQWDGLTFRDIGWRLQAEQSWWGESVLGLMVGVPLGVLYIFVLSPMLATVQQWLGDYVPPEQIHATLGSALIPFFIANVILAPWVEENIYRGYAMTRLSERLGVYGAVLWSCLFFGLLHWTGGFWYMVLTGVVAGGTFAGLFVWRRNIIATYTAHLSLNLVEFLLVWLIV